MLSRRHEISTKTRKITMLSLDKETEEIAHKVIGLAIKVHRELGPGFGEKIYQRAVYLELQKSGVKFEREKEIVVNYGNVILGRQAADFIVDGRVILELKKAGELNDAHKAQLLSYLKTTGLRLGLLLNFGKSTLEIKRVIV